ncbi:PsbP-related protein [Cohnella sp.]|uniref:PsbP-related protein n=1 Tax=Cohnella sp. TaxID=1883426 RepID=UPI0035690A7A
MKKPSAKLLKMSLFLALLALALSACGGKDDKGGASPSASPSASASESPSASPSASASESPSASPSASAEASEPAQAVPAGYKLFEDKVHGTTIQYPEDWTLQEGVIGIAVFLAPPEDANDPFSENINFIVEDLGGQSVSAKDYLELTKQQLGQLIQDFTLVDEEVDTEEGSDAAYMAYTGKQGDLELTWMQTVEIHEGKAYIITFTATRDSFDKYIEQVAEIADSWTIN